MSIPEAAAAAAAAEPHLEPNPAADAAENSRETAPLAVRRIGEEVSSIRRRKYHTSGSSSICKLLSCDIGLCVHFFQGQYSASLYLLGHA